MPIQDLIQVRVFVDGEEAIEYEDPDGVDEDNKCVRYIETRPGQKFSVYIVWLPGFRIRWADALYCLVDKNDGTGPDHNWFTARELWHDHGTLTKPALQEFSFSVHDDPTTGRCNLYEWAFEGVELIDSNSEFLSISETQAIGSIHVTVYRAKKIKLEGNCTADRDAYDLGTVPAPKTELPECMFKGKDVKQTVKYVNPKPYLGTIDNTTTKYKFVPKNGPAGEKFHFIFKHRDKKALRTLGCIPRDRTPPPDPTLLLEQYERALRLKKRKENEKDREVTVLKNEMEEMKRKMALLLSNRTAEVAESSENNTIFTPTTSSSETNNTEAVRDLQEITNPKPKPKPEDIIDLTGDSDSD